MEHLSEKLPARWESLPSWLLTQTANHAQRLVADGFSSVHARGYHYRLLATLEEFGPASQARTGPPLVGIHLSDMVAAINELADRKTGRARSGPLRSAAQHHLADRRGQAAAATTGEAAWPKPRTNCWAPLSPEERQRLTELLSRLLDHHNRANRHPRRAVALRSGHRRTPPWVFGCRVLPGTTHFYRRMGAVSSPISPTAFPPSLRRVLRRTQRARRLSGRPRDNASGYTTAGDRAGSAMQQTCKPNPLTMADINATFLRNALSYHIPPSATPCRGRVPQRPGTPVPRRPW